MSAIDTAAAMYRLSPARYAKGSMALRMLCAEGGFGGGRVARLAGALNARWSNRERAFILSASKARRFEQLYAEGWDGKLTFDSVTSTHYELEAPR